MKKKRISFREKSMWYTKSSMNLFLLSSLQRRYPHDWMTIWLPGDNGICDYCGSRLHGMGMVAATCNGLYLNLESNSLACHCIFHCSTFGLCWLRKLWKILSDTLIWRDIAFSQTQWNKNRAANEFDSISLKLSCH